MSLDSSIQKAFCLIWKTEALSFSCTDNGMEYYLYAGHSFYNPVSLEQKVVDYFIKVSNTYMSVSDISYSLTAEQLLMHKHYLNARQSFKSPASLQPKVVYASIKVSNTQMYISAHSSSLTAEQLLMHGCQPRILSLCRPGIKQSSKFASKSGVFFYQSIQRVHVCFR